MLTPCSPHSLLIFKADVCGPAMAQVASTVAEDGVYLLIGQLDRGLEDPAKRRAAAATITHFCKTTKHDFQEHIPQLLSVGVPFRKLPDMPGHASCSAQPPIKLEPTASSYAHGVTAAACLKHDVLHAHIASANCSTPWHTLERSAY